MADKYNLDYFDDDRVAAQRSQYRREYRQPMNRPPQNGRGHVPNNRNNVHRKPPKRKRFSRRLRNRIIIVSVGILILILIITMISSMFRACTGSDKKVDNNSDKTQRHLILLRLIFRTITQQDIWVQTLTSGTAPHMSFSAAMNTEHSFMPIQ